MAKDTNPEIPEMKIGDKYSTKPPIIPQNTDKIQKEMDKTKKELDKLKSWVLKKYPFTQSISILPPQSIPIFVEEEEVPKETEKYIQLYMIIPEEKYKEIPNITKEIVKEIEKIKNQKVWLQIKTPIDVWENSLDGKHDLVNAIGMSFPLHDIGFLGALRVAEIHKTLVVRKFEKYVVSYVIGGSLVRGEAVPTSDVDVFVIIDDTDVKRMPRLELLERLRNWIYKYVSEAEGLAGVRNKLSPQVYLLTDFWEGVKDAHPVMFTFIRDGIPIYDKGTFTPWKSLLRMGRLKPSPEAIDMFMSMGDKTVRVAKKNLLDIVIKDIYWGVITPSQAVLMLNGLPPPSPKHIVAEMKKTFIEKEKMLEMKYINILDKIIKIYKDFEHEKVKEIKGAEVDKLIKGTEDYLKRLKELRKQIEKRYQERTIEQIYKDTFKLLKGFIGNKSEEKIIEDFEKQYVGKGKFTNQHLRILKKIVEARKEFKKGKRDAKKIDESRRNATILTSALIEYTQRCDLISLERGKMILKYKDGIAELLSSGGKTFLLRGQEIKKIGNKIENSNLAELSAAIEEQKSQENINIDPKVFELLKKELGSFEIVL